MSTVHPKFPHHRHLDMIVFLAVLATGIALTLAGVPAGPLATIATALSGLYADWRRGRNAPPDCQSRPISHGTNQASDDPAEAGRTS